MNRFFVCILAISLAVGCSKKTQETVADTTPPPVTQKPTPSPSPSPAGGNPAGVASSGGGGVSGSPSSGLSVGGGGGAIQNTRQAVRRTEALNEMRTLGQAISLMQTELGRMPTKDQILAELKAYPKLLTAMTEGSFILTGTTDSGGLWAYEVDADVKPGIALIGGTATKSTPEDLQRYFPKK
jgi:hypothetical protein